jgi:SHS2 domain-containing protein
MSTNSCVRFLDHTADVGLDVTAPTLAELFRSAADGMFQLLLGSGHTGTALNEGSPDDRQLALRADDAAALFSAWLRELLYLYDVSGLCPVKVEFSELDARQLEANVRFGHVIGAPIREIKGVTYHQLAVRQEGGSWHARVVFDV